MAIYDTGGRFGFRALTGANPGDLIDDGIAALRDDIAAVITGYGQGTLASRPTSTSGSPGIAGRVYYATDKHLWYADYGTGWTTLGWNVVETSINYTAADGDLVVCLAPLTVTIPAPTLNARVRVYAGVGAGISGSSPIVVGVASGVYGRGGLSGAATFLLGTPGASAELAADSDPNWFIAAGAQDSGWVDLTLDSHWVAGGGGYAPQSRLVGDRVELRGGIASSTGANQPVATVTSHHKPASDVNLATARDNAGVLTPIFLVLDHTTGSISPTTTVLHDLLVFDGLSYSIV